MPLFKRAAAAGGGAPFTYAQQKANQATGSGTTVAVTLDSSVAAGSLIVVYADGSGDWITGSPTLTVSDSVNGAYTAVANRMSGGGDIKGWMYYFPASGAGTPTITATYSTSFTDKSIAAYVYTYSGSSVSVDQTSGNNSDGSTTSVTSGNVTTTAGTVAFAGYTDNANGSSLSALEINGTGAEENLASTARLETWANVFASTFTGQATATSSDNLWVCVLGTFKIATCSTSEDSNTGTEETLSHNQFGAEYTACPFTVDSTYTLCSVRLKLAKVGSPTFNDVVKIYTDSSGSPGTLVGTGSASKAASSYGTTASDQTFTGMSASLSAGTYWIVLQSDAAGGGGNYVTIQTDDEFVADAYKNSDDGTTWNVNANRQFIFTTFK